MEIAVIMTMALAGLITFMVFVEGFVDFILWALTLRITAFVVALAVATLSVATVVAVFCLSPD